MLYILQSLGPQGKWFNLVKECITSTKLAIVVNVKSTQYFCPQRGLRQGNPLTPSLFPFVMEYFTRLFQQNIFVAKSLGLKFGQKCLHIPILLFVDDCLVFLPLILIIFFCLKGTLTHFSSHSGQTINFNKSTLIFSPHTHPRFRRILKFPLYITT